VELPTYTNIWKIEKRLYKLYDFRLPMPLPIGQVAVFLAIAVPYMLILTMAGMPFSHTWVWLYVLPPGVLAWLVTRPVLEGKRLPELVMSQLRYLSEPRSWCRMAPLAEKDEIIVFARVWRRTAALPLAGATDASAAVAPSVSANLAVSAESFDPASFDPGSADAQSVDPESFDPGSADAQSVEAQSVETVSPEPADAAAVAAEPAEAEAEAPEAEPAASGDAIDVPARPVWPSSPAIHAPAAKSAPTPPPTRTARPGLSVRTDGRAAEPLHVVERALRSSPGGGPANGWRDRVVVVPGGHRPGKPDQVQRDQARARLPLAGPARIVVLGCTAGAGQTVTTMLTGQLLAGLRGEAVAVLDLGAGPGSLTEQARQIPRLLPGRRAAAGEEPGSGRERGLQVVTAGVDNAEPVDAGALIDAVVARYPLTLADPAAAQVPRALPVADQLVLVAPANSDAAGALAMTLEWLDGHGHAELARRAIAVLNGVSPGTAAQSDKAAAVATGRCRAIVRVPWDDGLSGGGVLGIAAVQAYAALAGVIVSGLADVTTSSAGQRSRGTGQ
jgi:hypothetical protein